ncbi:MAG TPA: molybdopterin-dependent oxidoreductase [Candidatus Limnocylindrales bacterium]|nr:molybdopterin-dependent oxidoreductase [Candidatus Limnocylindrales bacterium]
MPVRRRDVLKGGLAVGAVAGAAAGGWIGAGILGPQRRTPTGSLPVDRIVRTTCSPNCTGSCGQLAFVRDERIVKIQQAADYPDAAYNPRGCMKGLSYHLQVHGPDRILTPLVRTGDRGSGEFRPATWEEALDQIAGDLRRIGEEHGWDSIHVFGQVPGSGYVQKGANYRACALLGMSHGTSFDFNGDLPMGMPITFGVQNAEHEAKDWANSRFLLLVGANPVETRIPDVHFIWDAVERGARLVVVDPVFSGTAAKADAWLQPKPGTDAALALGLVRQILAHGAADEAFLRAYTDAPLLVRADTGRRLRERDLVEGIAADAPDRFVAWDPAREEPIIVGTERLGPPGGLATVALDGQVAVPRSGGAAIAARPSFGHVRDEVDRWTPERVEAVTGVPAASVVSLARAFAAEKPAAILMGGGANHWFHGDLTGRAFALLSAVTGNIGRSGGGYSVYVGQYRVRVDTSPWWSPGGTKAPVVPSIYFVRGRTPTMHPKVPYPAAGFKALVCTFANMFLQSPDVNRLHETLRGLELIVVVDHQMTDTVRWADVVLPATTWYEKTDLTATPLHPFLQLQQAAIAPVGESRSEVAIWREIVRRIDPALAAEWFDIDEDEAIRQILEAGGGPGGPTEGITLDHLRAGPVRLRVPDPDIPFLAQIRDLEPFPPRSLPAPLEATAAFVPTGRIEFYKEEARFLELGEQVPTHREPYDDGIHDPADWPLVLLSPHSKWRIHSTYSNNAWLAEIHGGRPTVLLHPDDAAARDIGDGDPIRVHNTRGSLEAWAHVSEAAGRGTATLPEGWWSRYFGAGKGVNELTSSEVNPIHEVHFVANMWSPSTGWKDCRCEVEKVGASVAAAAVPAGAAPPGGVDG